MPCHCPPPGCYPPVVENWEITNEWTGRSARVSSRLQPPQWPQHVWDTAMLHTGVPQYALDEFRRLSRPGRRSICDRGKSRSRSRSRGRYREIDRIHEGEYKNHVPSKQDFSFKRVEKEKEPSKKELKSVLKHQDSRLFFDISMGPHYGFNTCSDHPIIYDRLKFPTAEHLLSYFMHAERPEICHHLCRQPTAESLLGEARRFADKKSNGWKHDQFHHMEVVLWYKFTQHKSLRRLLLGTGERPITFLSPENSVWGVRQDGHGKNYLGKALEKTRWRIRTCTPPP